MRIRQTIEKVPTTMSTHRCLTDRAIVLNEKDNVATALVDMPPGEYILEGRGERTVTLVEQVPAGFKLALAPIAAGEEVIKYGYAVGTAQADIRPGECVHVHNLASSV